MLNAFIAANLAITAFNLLVTFIIFGMIFAGVSPPSLSAGAFLAILVMANVSIWLGVFAAVARA